MFNLPSPRGTINKSIARNRPEAEMHRRRTDHTDVNVSETDCDMEARQFEAVNKWVSAQCFDCGVQFTDRGEACEHVRIFPNHALLHVKDATVN